ncbi:MAG: hypothetical protein V2A76_16745 [Planctomycetota bacterium]
MSSRCKSKGKVIEFLGLPAAGKTTLALAVADILRAEGVRVFLPAVHEVHPSGGVRNKASRLAFLCGRFLRHPAALWRAFAAIRRTRQETHADLRTVLENLVTVAWLAERARAEGGVHLFDQGVFQAVWSVGLNAAYFDAKRHLTRLPRPDLLVLVTVEPQSGLSRLAARAEDGSRLGQVIHGQPHLYVHASNVLDAVREAADGLARERKIRIMSLDGTSPDHLEANAKAVAEAIAALETEPERPES